MKASFQFLYAANLALGIGKTQALINSLGRVIRHNLLKKSHGLALSHFSNMHFYGMIRTTQNI